MLKNINKLEDEEPEASSMVDSFTDNNKSLVDSKVQADPGLEFGANCIRRVFNDCSIPISNI